MRVLSRINRFLSNFRKYRLKGPLTTNELLKQIKLIIRKLQLQYSDTETFKINQKELNVQMSEVGLYQCFGRIQGELPIFIRNESGLAEILVEEAHILTIQGGVTLTMAKIRSGYRIQSLRKLVNKTIKKCYGCKRFHVSHYPEISTGLLPVKRTSQNLPLICKTNRGMGTKLYIILFTCSLIRAIYLELLPNNPHRSLYWL